MNARLVRKASPSLVDRVRAFFDDRSGPPQGILVALSGGQDSCALLHALVSLREELGCGVYAAHVNHCLRGEESDADERFARAFSESLGVECVTECPDVAEHARRLHRSTQEAARIIRHAFLNRTADRLGAALIALGHTEDDLVETVLLNLIRGTGIDGLSGLAPTRGRIIRPLLDVQRSETEAYCRQHGIDFRTDESNHSLKYLRNRIRLDLLPNLEANYNASFRRGIRRLAQIAADDADYLRPQVEEALKAVTIERRGKGPLELNRARLGALHPAIARRVIRAAILAVKGDLADVQYDTVNALVERLHDGGPRSFSTAGSGVTVRLRPDRITIANERAEHPHQSVLPVEIPLAMPGVTEAAPFAARFRLSLAPYSDEVEYPAMGDGCMLDAHRIRPPLVLRNRRRGDRIQPLGMAGTKKLSDLLIDRKVPRAERDRIPIMADGNGILWVVGHAVSERARITPQTRTTLIIRREAANTE